MRCILLACCVFWLAPVLVAAELTKDSTLDDILDALDARGQGLTSFVANVKLTDTDTALGDSTSHSGKVSYQGGEAQRIRVSFDKKVANGKITDDKVDYVLAGLNLVERNYHTRTQVTRQVLKPGQKMNLFKLGEGPFPLPIGQKKEDVHTNFDVKKISARSDDPPNTVHLQLSPKDGTPLARKFKSIDVWVDTKDNMPRQIETLDANGSSTHRAELSDVQINPAIGDADFTLPKIDEKDWQLHEEPFQP